MIIKGLKRLCPQIFKKSKTQSKPKCYYMDQYLYHINNRNGFGKYGNEIRIGIPIVVARTNGLNYAFT
jgi:hypothetical protein